MGHDVAARARRRHADRRGAHRRRALRRRQRHRPIELPDHPPAPRPRRGRRHRRRVCSPRPTSRSPPIASPRRRRRPRSSVAVAEMFPFAGSTEPMCDDPVEQILARTWRPTLSYVGADGFPPTGRAGNVLRPSTSLALSMRLPPTCDPRGSARRPRARAHDRPAVGSDRDVHAQGGGSRMERPTVRTVARAPPSTRPRPQPSASRPGRSAKAARSRSWGCSGRCSRRPSSSSPVCSCPGSNAHGPNEFLHLPTARRVTECVARLLAAHAASSTR